MSVWHLQGEPTIPSTLQEELDTNPFLRPSDPNIRHNLGEGQGGRFLRCWVYFAQLRWLCLLKLNGYLWCAGISPDAPDVEAWAAIRKHKDNF